MCTYSIILISLLAIVLIPDLLYLVSNGKVFKSIFHDKLGWHIVDEPIGSDGCSLHGICILCGKECKQDSQGNWF